MENRNSILGYFRFWHGTHTNTIYLIAYVMHTSLET